jgi:signal transduction histidine kinase
VKSPARFARVGTVAVIGRERDWNYGVDSTKTVRSTVLLRSAADAQVIEPPTWWTMRHVIYIAVALGILALIFLIQILRSLMERWRLQAVLEERERLAHEIHDTLAQSFAGIGFQLQAIRRAIPQELSRVQQQIDLAQTLVRHSHKEARRSIEPLRSEPREATMLLPSLEESARRMVEGGSVRISLSTSGNPRPITPRVGDTLLRIGREAIANAVRHADPSHLEIAVLYKRNTVTLSVQDDGIGFVKSGDLLGFGLRGMRKRAAAISAHLEIQSQPGSGSCITAAVRLPPAFTPVAVLKSYWSQISEHMPHVNNER